MWSGDGGGAWRERGVGEESVEMLWKVEVQGRISLLLVNSRDTNSPNNILGNRRAQYYQCVICVVVQCGGITPPPFHRVKRSP